MKSIFKLSAAASLAMGLALPTLAHNHTGDGEADMGDHAEHAEMAVDGDAMADAVVLSTATPIAALMELEEAAAVVTTHFPDLAAHPMYDQFKMMSLAQLAPMSQGAITPELLAAAEKDLAELNAAE